MVGGLGSVDFGGVGMLEPILNEKNKHTGTLGYRVFASEDEGCCTEAAAR